MMTPSGYLRDLDKVAGVRERVAVAVGRLATSVGISGTEERELDKQPVSII